MNELATASARFVARQPFWAVLLTYSLAPLATLGLMKAAGFGQPGGLAYWTVFLLCVVSLSRFISFVVWFALLFLSPRHAGGGGSHPTAHPAPHRAE